MLSVENYKQDNLKKQKESLKQYAIANGLIVQESSEDTDNGLNCGCKQRNALIDRCIEGEVDTIIVSQKDRFSSYEYEQFEKLLKSQGTDILVVNEESSSETD